MYNSIQKNHCNFALSNTEYMVNQDKKDNRGIQVIFGTGPFFLVTELGAVEHYI